jgi:hypothetical protein
MNQNYQTPATPPPPSPPPPPTPPANNLPPKPGLSTTQMIVIIVVIVVAAAAIGGFFFWWSNGREIARREITPPEPTPTVTVAITPTPTPTPTSARPTPTATPAPVPRFGVVDWAPASFDYGQFFTYSDEYLQDWYVYDSDFDGQDEVLAIGYSPSADTYHALLLDWNEFVGAAEIAYEQTFAPPFSHILVADWNGDGLNEFVIAHVANSGYGYALVYNHGLNIYEELFPSF